MFDEETRPNPMTPETNSGNTTEGQQHAEPYMTLEHNLEKRIDKLGPEMRTVAQNLIESRDINNGEIKSEVWADAMLKVYYLNNVDVDDNVFARDVILKYCADRRWRLGQDQHLSDAEKAKEFRIIEKYEAKAEEFNEKVTPSPDALRPPDQRMPTPQPDTLVPSPARVDVGGQNRPADAEKNQQAIGNWLFLGTGLDFESLPSEIQKELGRYVKIVSGTPSERAIIDRLFNYVWDLSSDQRLSEEQRNEMMSVLNNVAQVQESMLQKRTDSNSVLERIAQSSEEAARTQREALDLASTTYRQFVENQANHVIMFPPKWIENPPHWYIELSEEERSMVRAEMHINFIASRKDAEGSLDAYLKPGFIEGEQDIKVQIESKGLGYAWKNKPGYRIALVTLMNEIFELSEPDTSVPDRVVAIEIDDDGRENYKVYVNNQHRHSHLRLKEKYAGPNLISGQTELMNKLIDSLTDYFDNNPYLLSQYKLTNSSRLAAEAATIFAWNTIFMSAAVDSGDRGGRQRTLAGPHISTDSVRSMFMPLDKAMFKLDKESPQDVEEKWGGPLGDWFADRSIAHGRAFKAKVEEGNFHFFPERMFYGWMDYLVLEDKTTISDREQHIVHTSWGQAILRTSNVDLGNGLIDVTDPELLCPDQESTVYTVQGRQWKRSFRDGGSNGDLWWRYSARAGAVRKIYELLTEDEPKSDAGDFATAFSAIVSTEPWLRHIYYDLDFLTAAVSKLALERGKVFDKNAYGYLLGTDELVLNLNDAVYDNAVTEVLTLLLPRLYKEPRERRVAKNYILGKLHAQDVHTWGGTIRNTLGGMAAGRQQIRRKASQEITRRST